MSKPVDLDAVHDLIEKFRGHADDINPDVEEFDGGEEEAADREAATWREAAHMLAELVGLEPGQGWFVNEDGVVYDYDREKQSADFPGDFHTPFDTKAEAEVFADSLDAPEQDGAPLLYEKCLHCHLFVEPNEGPGGVWPQGEGIAEYVHLAREGDEHIDESHNARPSGLTAPLNTWLVFGPSAMRARFMRSEENPSGVSLG